VQGDGSPVQAEPGLTPRSPWITLLPVLVTVEPAKIPKLQAAPNGMPPGVTQVAEVVKVHTKLAASGMPNVSVAPVVMVAV